MPLKMDDFCHAAGSFDQIESQVAADVSPFSRSPAATLTTTPEDVAKSAITEHPAKRLKDIVEVREVRRAATGAIDSGVAESIVARSLVAIAKHLEGFGRFFEQLNCVRVPLVFVRMMADCQLAVRGGDFLVGRASRYPKNFVIVTLCRGHLQMSSKR